LDATKREGEFVEVGDVLRGAQAGAERAAEEIRELVVVEEAIAVAKQVGQHLHPAIPENQAEKSEQNGAGQEYSRHTALAQTNPEKGHKECRPAKRGDEAADHGTKRREREAFAVPVVIGMPRLAGELRGLAIVGGPAEQAGHAVDDEKQPGGTEKHADKAQHPFRCVVAVNRDETESGGFHEQADKEKGKSEESGFPAVDGHVALRGVVEEHGGKAGTAAEEAVGARLVGGEGDGHA